MKPITKLKSLFVKETPVQTYDRENLRPVIRESICTGEQTAGFKDVRTGKFSAVMLIRTDADLREFCRSYGIRSDEITTEY